MAAIVSPFFLPSSCLSFPCLLPSSLFLLRPFRDRGAGFSLSLTSLGLKYMLIFESYIWFYYMSVWLYKCHTAEYVYFHTFYRHVCVRTEILYLDKQWQISAHLFPFRHRCFESVEVHKLFALQWKLPFPYMHLFPRDEQRRVRKSVWFRVDISGTASPVSKRRVWTLIMFLIVKVYQIFAYSQFTFIHSFIILSCMSPGYAYFSAQVSIV